VCQQEQWRNQDRGRKRNLQKQRNPAGLAGEFAGAFPYSDADAYAYTRAEWWSGIRCEG